MSTTKTKIKKKDQKKKPDRYSKILFSRKESAGTYRAPKDVYADLNKEFHFTAQPEGKHGLEMDYWAKRVFVNTPFKDPTTWVERGLLEIGKGHTELAVYLLKADISTALFHDLVLPNAKELRAVRGRLQFSGKGNSPFGSIIAVFRGRKVVKKQRQKKPVTKTESSVEKKEPVDQTGQNTTV